MTLRKLSGILPLCAGLVLVPLPGSQAQQARAQCGPGNHWVDPCAAGIDVMPTTAMIGIDMDGDCRTDVELTLSGPVTVHRSGPTDDSVQFPVTRPVDGHFDVLDTEIYSMDLTDGSYSLRAGIDAGMDDASATCAGTGAGVVPRSCGYVAELPGDDRLADSAFNVWFEVELDDGTLLYNHAALEMGTVIDRVPPVADYMKPPDCVPLYDHPTAGIVIAYLTLVIHNTMEEAHVAPVEYSNDWDEEAIPGGGAHNGLDTEQVLYTFPLDAGGPPDPFDSGDFGGDGEVDALANRGDAFFFGLWNGAPARADTVDLLVSFFDDQPKPPDIGVWQETALWARGVKWAQFDLSNPDPAGDVDDVDGLELWGPRSNHVDPWTGWDANMFSLVGDPGGPTSVYYHVGPAGPSVAYVPRADIFAAVQALGYIGAEADVDLDALMVSDRGSRLVWDNGDRIIFSIRAVALSGFHGGEIIKLQKGAAPSFLWHGGHFWDNVWLPIANFPVGTNEVDGIEAMPPKGHYDWGTCWWGPFECRMEMKEVCEELEGDYTGEGKECSGDEQGYYDPPPPEPPAISEWGVVVMALLGLIAGTIIFARRRRLTAAG